MKIRQNLGFTLIELLVTVALVAIVLTLAGPSFRELILNNQRAANINSMVASLNLARAEAVKRSADTVVCITDGASSPDCAAAATQWEQGWLVVADIDRDGVVTRADGDLVVQVQDALPQGTIFRGNANVANDVTFDGRGFAPGSNGTLLFCDLRGDGEARRIIIDRVGRTRLDVGPGGGLRCP